MAQAIKLAREYAPFVRKIEVETENLDMVREAVDAGADIIMLDNMSPEDMREAVRIIGGRAETECSGNVTKEKIEQLTGIGLDYISVRPAAVTVQLTELLHKTVEQKGKKSKKLLTNSVKTHIMHNK